DVREVAARREGTDEIVHSFFLKLVPNKAALCQGGTKSPGPAFANHPRRGPRSKRCPFSKPLGEPMSYRTLTGASALALAALALTMSPAQADSVSNTSCVGRWLWGTCTTVWRHGTGDPHIRHVPAPLSDAEVAESRERERGWLAVCRPAIYQDRY